MSTNRLQLCPLESASANAESSSDCMAGLEIAQSEWKGVLVETERHPYTGGPVAHRIPHEHSARLSVVLEAQGGVCAPRLEADTPYPVRHQPQSMSFASPGMPLWGYSENVTFVHHVLVCFNPHQLQETFGETVHPLRAEQPRLGFANTKLWTLAKLLAEASETRDASASLYADGLITAIAGLLFSSPKSKALSKPSTARASLTPRQLRRVLEYMEAKLPGRIQLPALAQLVDLSPSHFSHAFKNTTGHAPYQWQLQARIDMAKQLLLVRRGSLEEVAAQTGFADAVHFGRSFRRITGETPAGWRRRHR